METNMLVRKEFLCDYSTGCYASSVVNDEVIGSTLHHHTQGRLDSVFSAWCAKQNTVGEWWEHQFNSRSHVIGVRTKGRHDSDCWVTSYKLLTRGHRGALMGDYVENGRVFSGNWDRSTVVENNLATPLQAVAIRIEPQTWKSHMCMRSSVMIVDQHYYTDSRLLRLSQRALLKNGDKILLPSVSDDAEMLRGSHHTVACEYGLSCFASSIQGMKLLETVDSIHVGSLTTSRPPGYHREMTACNGGNIHLRANFISSV